MGRLVAYYPFNGNANDESGFNNHGSVSGATLVNDRFGNPNSAYYFDGTDDYARINNHPSLNNQKEITVNFWMSVNEFFGREAYPISHGNWENRWKISISNNYIRWTVKTTSAIRDLDSSSPIVLNTYYCVTATYDGSIMKIYLNGEFQNEKTTNNNNIVHTKLNEFHFYIGGAGLNDYYTYQFYGHNSQFRYGGLGCVTGRLYRNKQGFC